MTTVSALMRSEMRVVDLGKDVPYPAAMARMKSAMERVDVDGPVLFLLEHSPVITTTRRGGLTNVFSSKERLAAEGIELIETDRGGDVTFHGPGQLVGYPVLRLGPTSLGCDVVGYVRDLEEALIEACRALGVDDAHRKPERDDSGAHLTGVWCEAPVVAEDTLGCNFLQIERETCKLIAIGVGLSGGVTRHGFALNVTTDLELYLKHIVPCGLSTRGVTSLDRALGRTPAMDDVKRLVADAVLKRVAPRTRTAT